MDLRGKKNNITFIFLDNDFLSVFPCCDVFVFYLVRNVLSRVYSRCQTCVSPYTLLYHRLWWTKREYCSFKYTLFNMGYRVLRWTKHNWYFSKHIQCLSRQFSSLLQAAFDEQKGPVTLVGLLKICTKSCLRWDPSVIE